MNDTDPEMERMQIKLLREAGPKRRLAMATSLTSQTWKMAHNALAKSRPELSDIQRQILFVKIHYGSELAKQLHKHFYQQSSL